MPGDIRNDANAKATNATDKPMHLIFFETALVAIADDGRVLIALFDGSLLDTATKSSCVALCHAKEKPQKH
jgi:hypothetical protein